VFADERSDDLVDAAEKILTHFGFEGITDHGDSYRACCKIHGGSNPFSFIMNKTSLLWFCHACNEGGSVLKLIRLLSTDDPEQIFTDIVGEDYEVPQKDLDREENIKWINENTEEEKMKVQVSYGTPMNFKRFKMDTVEHFKGVPTRKVIVNGRTYYDKLAIPVEGGFALRALDNTKPKWLYTKGVQSSKHLFHMGKESYNTIIVVEGIFDVFAFYEAMKEYETGEGIEVVCTFTCHMSKEQAQLLLKENCRIVICYDGDEPGQRGNIQAYSLLYGKTEVEVLKLPDGSDPDDVPRWWLAREIERIKRW